MTRKRDEHTQTTPNKPRRKQQKFLFVSRRTLPKEETKFYERWKLFPLSFLLSFEVNWLRCSIKLKVQTIEVKKFSGRLGESGKCGKFRVRLAECKLTNNSPLDPWARTKSFREKFDKSPSLSNFYFPSFFARSLHKQKKLTFHVFFFFLF